jgi:hypothetical protein
MRKKAKRKARLFFVDTRFQRMARRPGAIPREEAIERAQAILDELKPAFVDWLDRELQALGPIIRQVAGGSNPTPVFDHAYRTCGELRDVGATMGYELVTHVASNLCEILDVMKTNAAFDREMIECHFDALLLARQEPYRHLRPEHLPEMISGLRRVVELAGNPRSG